MGEIEKQARTPWAKRGDVGFHALDPVQSSLTVDMIMTRRSNLVTCRPDDNARAVAAGNKKNRYSFLPVVDEDGHILGLFRAEDWFDEEAADQPVGDDFQHLSEDLVIGADAGVLEFVTAADERPARLIVSGDRIVGLIHLSDLQQLPVRAALFTLITSLEMAMAERIEAEWPDDSNGWLNLLSDGRRAKTLEHIDIARKRDGLVGEIVSTQLHDKADIIVNGKLLQESRTKLKDAFENIRNLRDNVAHANYYAETPEAAREICEVVRTIFRIKADLLQGISERTSAAKGEPATE